MKCPKCNGKVRVVDNVDNYGKNENYRQRKCTICKYRFYTVETIAKQADEFIDLWNRYHRH